MVIAQQFADSRACPRPEGTAERDERIERGLVENAPARGRDRKQPRCFQRREVEDPVADGDARARRGIRPRAENTDREGSGAGNRESGATSTNVRPTGALFVTPSEASESVQGLPSEMLREPLPAVEIIASAAAAISSAKRRRPDHVAASRT